MAILNKKPMGGRWKFLDVEGAIINSHSLVEIQAPLSVAVIPSPVVVIAPLPLPIPVVV